ncbi:hypothetical protein [Sphingomonas sp. T1]|uniref:hypothetical protein n=1 Tax=Sphingomonas sp. T1 TaxID=2653172 RepID=UPI001F18A9D0|nr:hypothetical protein [Sphingomonas sp. T1]
MSRRTTPINAARSSRSAPTCIARHDGAGGIVDPREKQQLAVRGDLQQLDDGIGLDGRIERRHERLQRGEHLAVDRVEI